jgi:serine/threonine protein phosphatase PrpC
MAIRPHPTAAPALDGAASVPWELDIAGAQILGDREVQEDAFLISYLGDSASLVIVADGMGGHAAGNIASNMAVQTCNRHLCHHHESRRLPALLREAVLEANKTIADMVHETEALRGMGCTLVAAVAHDATLSWASVGDSHLYLVRGGGISKLNADHSYGGFLDRMAALGQPVEPEPGCARNMLMCALTGEEIMEIDCPDTGTRISSGDWLIACSDGLNTLNRDDITDIVGGASSARECAERLLQAVTEAQTKNQDNTTVVAIRVQSRITTPRPSISVAPPVAPAALPDQPLIEPESRTSHRSRIRWLAAWFVVVILLALVYWLGMGGSETPGPAPSEPVATIPWPPIFKGSRKEVGSAIWGSGSIAGPFVCWIVFVHPIFRDRFGSFLGARRWSGSRPEATTWAAPARGPIQTSDLSTRFGSTDSPSAATR